MLGQSLDRLNAKRGVGEILENDIGGVRPRLEQGSLASITELDHQAEGFGMTAHEVDQVQRRPHGGGDPPRSRPDA